MKRFSFLFLLLFGSFTLPYENRVAHVSLGGGYFDAGENHSGGLFQVEYKFSQYFWRFVRPEVTLVVPNFNSFFMGVGAGIEIPIYERLLFCPNFCPGYYYQGNGKNLGYPLEFRSAVEVCYEFQNKSRLGGQFWHISNASLSSKNPGANGLVAYYAFPLSWCKSLGCSRKLF